MGKLGLVHSGQWNDRLGTYTNLNVCETLPNEWQIAIALEDYSAYELPVNQDEIVIGSRYLNGWLWCRKENSTKEGWVPIRCLKRSIESL